MFGAKELTEKLEQANKRIGELDVRIKDLKEVETTLKKEYASKEKMAVAMMEIEKKEAILKIKGELQTEFNTKSAKANEENYEKLSASLTKLHEEGNATSQYVQELSLKFIDKMSPSKAPLLESPTVDVKPEY